MRTFTVTREEYDRWPEETKVVFDMALDRGATREVSEGEALWVLQDARQWTRPAIMYWRSHSVIFSAIPRGDEVERRFKDCPFARLDEWDMQQDLVPQASRLSGNPIDLAIIDEVAPQAGSQESMWWVNWFGTPPRQWFRLTPPQRRPEHHLRGVHAAAAASHSTKSRVPPQIAKKNVRLDGRR